jgi:hypothetical protein
VAPRETDVWYRLFAAAFWAALSWSGGALLLWLLGQLELPPALQRHHPMAGVPSPQFDQTRYAFLTALVMSGAAWGALLPARVRYSERKLRELDATAKAMAWLWGLFAVMVVTVAATDDPSIWIFALFAALGAAGWFGTAAVLRMIARVLVWRRRGLEAADEVADEAPRVLATRPVPASQRAD